MAIKMAQQQQSNKVAPQKIGKPMKPMAKKVTIDKKAKGMDDMSYYPKAPKTSLKQFKAGIKKAKSMPSYSKVEKSVKKTMGY